MIKFRNLTASLAILFVLVIANEPSLLDIELPCNTNSSILTNKNIIINELNDSIALKLNRTFYQKFQCVQLSFDETLLDMQNNYNLFHSQSNKTELVNLIESSKTKKKEKSKKKNESKSEKDKLKYKLDMFGQVGFIYYSMDGTFNTNDFKHETFTFAKPSEQGFLNQTEIETKIANYNNDIFVLKSLLENAKHKLKSFIKQTSEQTGLVVRDKKDKKSKKVKKDKKKKQENNEH